MRKKILSILTFFYLITIAYAFLLAAPPVPKSPEFSDEDVFENEEEDIESTQEPVVEEDEESTREPAVIESEPLSEVKPPRLSEEEVPSIEDNKVTLERPPVGESPQYWGLTLMGGAYRPDDYRGRGNPFSEIYGSGGSLMGDRGTWVDMSFEWQPIKQYGRLGLKLSSGSWFIYKEYDSPTDGDTKKDKYTLWVLPGILGGVYRMQYWEKQPLIPFIEGGGGILRFEQFTPDKEDRYKDIYRSVGMFGAGLQINADLIDPKAGREFDINWGVNTTYLVLEYRILKTSDYRVDSASRKRNFDFTGSNLITGGLLFEF